MNNKILFNKYCNNDLKNYITKPIDTYFSKYIKYKKKYLSLKNQIGSASKSDSIKSLPLVNTIGTCWYHVILTTFLNSKKTRKSILNSVRKLSDLTFVKLGTLITDRMNIKSFKPIGKDQIGITFQLVELIQYIVIRFDNSLKKSFDVRTDIECETRITENFRFLFPDEGTGGTVLDRFNMANILSINLLDKYSNFCVKSIYQLLPEDEINCTNENITGFMLTIPNHTFSVYENESGYQYANNGIKEKFTALIVINDNKHKITHDFRDVIKIMIYNKQKNNRQELFLINDQLFLRISDSAMKGGSAVGDSAVGDLYIKKIKKKKAEKKSKKKAEKKSKKEAEEIAKKEAEKISKKEAEEIAKKEAEEIVLGPWDGESPLIRRHQEREEEAQQRSESKEGAYKITKSYENVTILHDHFIDGLPDNYKINYENKINKNNFIYLLITITLSDKFINLAFGGKTFK